MHTYTLQGTQASYQDKTNKYDVKCILIYSKKCVGGIICILHACQTNSNPQHLKMYQMVCITSDYIYTPVFLLTDFHFFSFLVINYRRRFGISDQNFLLGVKCNTILQPLFYFFFQLKLLLSVLQRRGKANSHKKPEQTHTRKSRCKA